MRALESGNAYMRSEIVKRLLLPLKMPSPRTDSHPPFTEHLYLSQYDVGSVTELHRHIRDGVEPTVFLKDLRCTSDADRLKSCEHMLLTLTADTWTRNGPGFESIHLANEVRTAMTAGVHVLLVHEVPSGCEVDKRKTCAFRKVISETPKDLLHAGIYNEIAMNVGYREWRKAGLAKIAEELVKYSKQRGDPRSRWRTRQSESLKEQSIPQATPVLAACDGADSDVSSTPTNTQYDLNA